MDRMKRLIETLRILINEEFSGYIRINFSQGSIGRVEKSEEIENSDVSLPETVRVSRKRNYSEGEGHTK